MTLDEKLRVRVLTTYELPYTSVSTNKFLGMVIQLNDEGCVETTHTCEEEYETKEEAGKAAATLRNTLLSQ